MPWLTDRKWAHIRLEGQAFGDVPLNVELKLEVWDSPNSAGIVIDAVRCCKLALNNGIGGQLDGPARYLMKSPHNQRPDDEAREDDRGVHRQVRRASAAPKSRPQGPKAPTKAAAKKPQPSDRRAASRSPTLRRRPAAGGPSSFGTLSCDVPCPSRFSIAQVTPYAVGGARTRSTTFVARGLARSSPRAGTASLIVAPSASPKRVREAPAR